MNFGTSLTYRPFHDLSRFFGRFPIFEALQSELSRLKFHSPTRDLDFKYPRNLGIQPNDGAKAMYQ